MSPVISAPRMAAMAVTLCLCVFFPVLLWVLLGRRQPGFSRAVLAGTVGFLVPQLLLRMPLVQLISGQEWFQRSIGASIPVLYLFLAFTAGLFETAGRALVFRFLIKPPLSPRLGLAAGLGHGGAEAVVLVGLTYVNNLAVAFLVNSGQLPLTGQARVMADLLANTPPSLFLLAGYERVCTVLFHMALSLLLALFWVRGRGGRGFWACVGLHTLLDFAVPLANFYTNYWVTYGILSAAAAAGGVFIYRHLRPKAAAS